MRYCGLAGWFKTGKTRARTRVRVRVCYLDKIMGVLDFQGLEGFFCVIFYTPCVIFDTLYTLDKTQKGSYNDTKPNKEVRA
jgi:hypothetical protein